jgi:hypothetical protein
MQRLRRHLQLTQAELELPLRDLEALIVNRIRARRSPARRLAKRTENSTQQAGQPVDVVDKPNAVDEIIAVLKRHQFDAPIAAGVVLNTVVARCVFPGAVVVHLEALRMEDIRPRSTAAKREAKARVLRRVRRQRRLK